MSAIAKAATEAFCFWVDNKGNMTIKDLEEIIKRELEKAERPWKFNDDGTPNDDFSEGVDECRKLMGLGEK